jgi:hypothetical protein
MSTNNPRLLPKLLPIIFILLLTIIFFHPIIFQDKTFYAFDSLLQYLPWSPSAPNARVHNDLLDDPVNLFYPYLNFVKKCLNEQTFPVWDNSTFCGKVTGLPTHPIVLLFYFLLPQSIAHDLLLWFHLLGAGLFMFLYLKEIGLKTSPALIGAVSWMFNGYVMVWFEFENVILLAPALAATLYFLELWLKTRTLLHCLCLTGAVALSISTGYANLLIYQFIFLCLYFVYRYYGMQRENSDFQKIGRKELLSMSLAVLLLLCIASGFIIGNIKNLSKIHEGSSQRREFSFDELYLKTGKLPARYLTTLLFPDFLGSPVRRTVDLIGPRINREPPYNYYHELCIYSGIAPLFLILVCLPCVTKQKFALFYLLTAMLTLAMAMGSIVYYPLARFVPGLNLSTPTRILYMFGFSIAVLAAIGADILTGAKDKKKWLIISLWSLLLGTALTIAFFMQTEAGINWVAGHVDWTDLNPRVLQEYFSLSSQIISKPLILVFLSFIALVFALIYRTKKIALLPVLMILSYDLISFGLNYNTASPRDLEYPQTDAIRFLKEDKSAYRIIPGKQFAYMHNGFAPFDIQDVGGYGSFYPRRYAEFLHLSQHGPAAPFPSEFSRWIHLEKFSSPLLNLINVKYLLIPPSRKVWSPTFKLVYDNEIKIYENKAAFPRAFFVPGYQFCDSQRSAYETMATYNESDFRKKVIVESMPPEDFRQNNTSNNNAESRVKLISYKQDRIEIEVLTDRKGFLVLSDNYHPGWRAKVDGEQTEVLLANYIMRAVPVKTGTHKVVLTFPTKLRYLIPPTMGWFILTILIGVLTVYRKKRLFHQSHN